MVKSHIQWTKKGIHKKQKLKAFSQNKMVRNTTHEQIIDQENEI